MKTVLIIWFFLSYNIGFSQEIKTFYFENYKVVYTITNGRISGDYKSYYSNDSLRSEGCYLNNYRIGKWVVWDVYGVKKVERNYSSPLEYKTIFPKPSTQGPIPLLLESVYELEYNDKNYIQYCFIEERSILWSKRVWRNIKQETNPTLFDDNFMFSTLYYLVKDSSIIAYRAYSDKFKSKLIDPLKKITDYKVIKYKLKEDWFFDVDRLVMESRIIGICPVVEFGTDTLDLFWIYFPEVRAHFAKVTVLDQPKRVKTLDDFFFFRCFSSQIFKESNIFNTEIKPEDIEVEAEIIEIKIIEKEHDIWLSFN